MKANNERKRCVPRMAIWLATFQIAIFFWGTTMAAGGTTHPSAKDPFAWNGRADVLKILVVLEDNIEDQLLLEKTKKKLFTLNEGQTRLIASLSDRVAKEGDAPGASIAFLLMTVLITLL